MYRLLYLLFLTGAALASKPNEAVFEKKGNLDEDGQIRIEHVAGKVRVTQGAQGDFKVVATIRVLGVSEALAKERLAHVKIDVQSAPKSLTVKTLYDQESTLQSLSDLFRQRDLGVVEVDYEITVPSGPPIDVESVSGEVFVDGRFKGVSTVKTVSGGITQGHADDAKLTSVSGPIELKKSRGPWSVESVSGTIDVSLDMWADSDGKASSVSGKITLLVHPKAAAAMSVKAETTSGTVKNDMEIEGGHAVKIKTVSGDISATIRE